MLLLVVVVVVVVLLFVWFLLLLLLLLLLLFCLFVFVVAVCLINAHIAHASSFFTHCGHASCLRACLDAMLLPVLLVPKPFGGR